MPTLIEVEAPVRIEVDPHAPVSLVRQREIAARLLEQLLDAKRRCAELVGSLNRVDLFGAASGRSPLDPAIASTTSMIEHLDRQLAGAPSPVPAAASDRSERRRPGRQGG